MFYSMFLFKVLIIRYTYIVINKVKLDKKLALRCIYVYLCNIKIKQTTTLKTQSYENNKRPFILKIGINSRYHFCSRCSYPYDYLVNSKLFFICESH